MKKIIYSTIALVLFGCNDASNKTQISNPNDYNTYLDTKTTPTLDELKFQREFWSKRLDADSTGLGDIAQLAGVYEGLFAQTGKMEFLKNAENLYQKGIAVSAVNYRDGLQRGLAHNYISQHRFKEAHFLLKQSYEGISDKKATTMMLYDTAMELGFYDEAYGYLTEMKDLGDYNYLIRIAKWSDHEGHLDDAIHFMEMAKKEAEDRDSKSLKIWTYSNLADFYGHAGKLRESYDYYLKTLALQPDNAYVKKSLAWLAFSAEGKGEEALRILDSVVVTHQVPDYHLMRAEVFEYLGDMESSKKETEAFAFAVNEGNYGNMYNTYLIGLYADSKPAEALSLAEKEILNRDTPDIYGFLAYAQLKNGLKEKALQTIQKYVEGNTFEPIALYQSAAVYRANGDSEKVTVLKLELLNASYELGPLLIKKIKAL
ncbi:MAG TPA: cell surface protein [Flavobacteriaceae bacterium]|nr:cell surface protein [Flavobacteriaceae bacterium]HPF12410.1 cell surface protein [Flavobacteriaceae bacterium]HQU21594.1 cell surface protein [Flavobacteriaceae bacterium]HQU66155.1 cell surface protein [Flavobacteriaceae bacterium]HRW45755.1 cell surface protein [Flavobacteriaceae bacterium]